MYKTYSDEELRRVLTADPKDAEAIVEAADRFLASMREEDEVLKFGRCGGYDVRPA